MNKTLDLWVFLSCVQNYPAVINCVVAKELESKAFIQELSYSLLEIIVTKN